MPQNVDDAALADLALQPCEEFLPHRAVIIEIEGREQRRLCDLDERPQLRQIDSPCSVVGFRIAEAPVVQPYVWFRWRENAAARWG